MREDANISNIEIPFHESKITVERWGKGTTGVIFFSNSGDMAAQIHRSILKYGSLWAGDYSFFLWKYPQSHPFDEIGDSMMVHQLKSQGVNVNTALAPRADGSLGKLRTSKVVFSGVATSVMNEIQKLTGLKKYLLVGDSMGAGIILWDENALQSIPDVKMLLISPTDIFSPGSLPELRNTVLIANAEGDEWDTDKNLMKWVAANKYTPTDMTLAPGHLILGQNLFDDDLCKLISLATTPHNP